MGNRSKAQDYETFGRYTASEDEKIELKLG